MSATNSAQVSCSCMRCKYGCDDTSASRSVHDRDRPDLALSTASDSSSNHLHRNEGCSVDAHSSYTTPSENSGFGDGRKRFHPRTYESPRYPHWFGRPVRGTPKATQSPSKQELIKRLEAVHAENRELLERMKFFQRRLRQVARERDATYRRYFDPRWEKARLFSKWMWPDLAEDTWVDEMLVDEVPDWVTNWDFLKQ